MTSERSRIERLLRWYPPSWRDRYGDEFMACVEDMAGDRPPSLRTRASVVVAGLRERARAMGSPHPGGRRTEPAQGAALVVLVGWTLAVVGGMSFAKASEHFAEALPATATAPRVADGVLLVAAGVAAVAVLLGALTALPALRRLVAGGWGPVLRPVGVAAGCTLAAGAATVPLGLWAGQLSTPQRNGGDAAYLALWLVVAACWVVAVGTWAAAAVAVGRRLPLEERARRTEAVLATVVALCTVVVTAAAAGWVVAMTHAAPGFFGAPSLSPLTASTRPELGVALGAMGLGSVVALVGVTRLARLRWR